MGASRAAELVDTLQPTPVLARFLFVIEKE